MVVPSALVARISSLPPLATEVLAGYVAGSAKTALFFPLDTITTLRESRVSTRLRSTSSYYTGLGVTLLGALPYAVLFHTAFHVCERALSAAGMAAAAIQLWAGMAGAIAAALVGVPFECMKHRLQYGRANGVVAWSNPRKVLIGTIRQNGIRGLYTGLGSTLARNVPYNALHFGLFEAFTRYLSALPAGLCSMIAGAFAGALTALLTTPLDMINTRIQVGTNNTASVTDLIAQIWNEEGGPVAFMQGAGVRVAQYAPSALVFFAVYRFIKTACI